MTSLLDHIDEMLYGRLLAAVSLAVVAFELVVFVMAVRRRGRAPLPLKLHAIAGLAILAVPVLAAVSVHAARAMMLDVLAGDGTDLGEKATVLSRGIAGQLNAIPFAVSVMLWALGLWFVPLTFAVRAPRPDGRVRSLHPAALIAFGFVPIAMGALRWSAINVRAFAATAGVAPDDKGVILAEALDQARTVFRLFARTSQLAIPALAIAAIVLIVVRARRRDVAAPPPVSRTPPRLLLAASGAALLLAALLLVEARPMARENDLPWPPASLGAQLVTDEPPTPDVVGPDTLERAPVVQVHKHRLDLDGMTIDADSLETKLTTLRNNFKLLHPGERFNEMVVIVADPTTTPQRLLSVLQAIRAAWYHKSMFAFTKAEFLARPVLGQIKRISASGAQVRLIYADAKDDDEDEYEDNDEIPVWKNAVTVRPQDFPAYDTFARRLVQLRRDGKRVIVKIDHAPR